MTEPGQSAEEIHAFAILQQFAECKPADIGVGDGTLAEVALVDFADDVAIGLVAIVDAP